jgi:hypothetical protein
MALQQLNIRISDEEHQHLESLASQTEGILTKQAVARLLIQHSIVTGWQPLTSDPIPQTMGEPAARRASSSKEEKNTNPLTNKSKSAKKEIPFGLEEHSEQIAEFMRVKKGSKGETAWKLLIGELEKIRAKYGSAVVAEQLQLAINGKWQGVQLSNYERFLPKAASPAQGYGGQKSIAELSEEMRSMPSLDQLLGRS